MANNAAPTAKASAREEEERLEDALYRLNQLHLQLRQLRSALPRMLEPLRAKQPSPQAAFSAYVQSIEKTKKEIASFQEALIGVQQDGTFALVSKSQSANPKGIKQWRARDDPDWANPAPKRQRVS